MKSPAQRLILALTLTSAIFSHTHAQDSPSLPVKAPEQLSQGSRRLAFPRGIQTGQPDPSSVLAENYRVTLTITGIAPEKAESSVLTSSKQISLSNVIPVPGDAGLLQNMEFSGFLGDPTEGRLELSYTLNLSFPTPDIVKALQKGITANGVHYLNERASGTLRVTPGKSYEVLRSGVRIYTLKVEVEAEGK
jgi:hypothetical protein